MPTFKRSLLDIKLEAEREAVEAALAGHLTVDYSDYHESFVIVLPSYEPDVPEDDDLEVQMEE
jgi:hypothetical protein